MLSFLQNVQNVQNAPISWTCSQLAANSVNSRSFGHSFKSTSKPPLPFPLHSILRNAIAILRAIMIQPSSLLIDKATTMSQLQILVLEALAARKAKVEKSPAEISKVNFCLPNSNSYMLIDCRPFKLSRPSLAILLCLTMQTMHWSLQIWRRPGTRSAARLSRKLGCSRSSKVLRKRTSMHQQASTRTWVAQRARMSGEMRRRSRNAKQRRRRLNGQAREERKGTGAWHMWDCWILRVQTPMLLLHLLDKWMIKTKSTKYMLKSQPDVLYTTMLPKQHSMGM